MGCAADCQVQAKPEIPLFVSYSHSDREWVSLFVAALKEHQVDVWYDREGVPAGERLDEAIQKALRASDVIILVVSDDALRSPWLFFELGAAQGMGKRLIAVVSELHLPVASGA